MTVFQSFIYGAVQGITELFPISSSGHLILLSEVYKEEPTIITLVSLHLASALALLIIYKDEILQKIKIRDLNYLKNIIIASIPVIAVGVVMGDKITELFYNPIFIAFNLIFWGAVMIVTEISEVTQNDKVSYKSAILIGIMQTLSLLPGTSRSGITTLAGVWSGMSKTDALAFTFIMGIALLFGTFSFEVIKDLGELQFSTIDPIAFISAFIFSLIAGSLLKRFSKEKFLTISGLYRIILGCFLLLLL